MLSSFLSCGSARDGYFLMTGYSICSFGALSFTLDSVGIKLIGVIAGEVMSESEVDSVGALTRGLFSSITS